LAVGVVSVWLTGLTLLQERRDRDQAFQELRRLWDATQVFHKHRGRLTPDAVASLRASFLSFPALIGESPEDRHRRWDELAIYPLVRRQSTSRLRELALEPLSYRGAGTG